MKSSDPKRPDRSEREAAFPPANARMPLRLNEPRTMPGLSPSPPPRPNTQAAPARPLTAANANRTMTQMSFGPSPAVRGAPPVPVAPVHELTFLPEPEPARVLLRTAPPPPPAPARSRNWALWIIAPVAAIALVTAGYLGALVQLGGGQTPRLVTDVSPATEAPAPPPAPARAPAVPAAPAAQPNIIAAAPRAEPAAPTRYSTPKSSRWHATKSSTSRGKSWSHESVSAASEPEQEPAQEPQPEAQQAQAQEPPPPALERQDSAPVLTIRPMPTTPEPSPASPAVAEAMDELAQASGETGSSAEESAVAPQAGRPHREDVQRTLTNLRPQLLECAAGRHGKVDATVTIAADGHVSYSLIRGAFVGSPEGSCMARALRAATFPPFQGPNFKVLFPYSL